jgi:heptosyltransferase III
VEPLNLQHILVVRTDRIGDVILTLPLVEVLKTNFPRTTISMMVTSYTAPLVEGSAEVFLYNSQGSFFGMVAALRRARIDVAVVAYPRFRIALMLWFAGIPIRIGTGYRWYSFLFNRRVYEHRKTVTKHESEYNISLAKELGCSLPEKVSVQVVISEQAEEAAQDIRRSLNIGPADRLVLLHPGSGGSARDWKPERFAQLALDLKKNGFCVVITGGLHEAELVHRVQALADNQVRAYVSTVGLKEFAALIQTAELFVANSTGPLHIAAAVGTPVLGFYPPVRVMSPKRWGPITEKQKIFVPNPAQCQRCRGGECRGSDCMDQIAVTDVVHAAMELMKR